MTSIYRRGTMRYEWLGTKERAEDAPSGITLMGVRLYNPSTGRFLSVDPVLASVIHGDRLIMGSLRRVDRRKCLCGKGNL